MENINNDSKIKYWYSSYELSEQTQVTYSNSMRKFCNLVGKTPTELIKEAENEIRKGLLPSERKIGGYIAQFKKLLKDNNASPKTQASSLAAIKSFYTAFDIILPAASCRIKRALPLEDNMHFLKKEDVHNMIVNAANLRDKAIILLMATSGMARNEVINLRIKNLIFDEPGIGIIKVRRQKTNVDYITFCSTEASTAIKAYLEERNRIPQNVSRRHYLPLDKLKVKGNNDYVFVDYMHAKKIEPRAFNSIFRRQADKTGYYNGKGMYRKTRSHALRKYFSSTLENAGMPKPKVDYLLGHHRSGNDIAYFNVDPELLKQLYIDYLPYITFERDVHIQSIKTEDEKRLAEVETRNKQLESEITEIKAILNDIMTSSKEHKPTILINRKEDELNVVDHREGDRYIIKRSYKKPKPADD